MPKKTQINEYSDIGESMLSIVNINYSIKEPTCGYQVWMYCTNLKIQITSSSGKIRAQWKECRKYLPWKTICWFPFFNLLEA